jgi:hypothetical protein
VSLTPGGALKDELGPIRVHEVERRRGFDATLYKRLFSLFRSLRADVVHTHNSVPLEYAAPAARLARVKRTVHTKHGHIAYSKAALKLARVATKCVDHFVAVSADTAVTISVSGGGVTKSAVLMVTRSSSSTTTTGTATLTVTASGRSGETVGSTPAGLKVAVGSTGSASFATGTTITLSVSNGRDAIWSGACSSNGNKTKTCTFTLNANASVSANVQ